MGNKQTTLESILKVLFTQTEHKQKALTQIGVQSVW